MSLLEDLRAEMAQMTPEQKAELAETLGLHDPAGTTLYETNVTPHSGSVCLRCGLEWRFNTERVSRLAAGAQDGSDNGWGVSSGPTGLHFCVQCRERTRWGKRPSDGIPLPGEPANPELQATCTHKRDGKVSMSVVSVVEREPTSGFVLDEMGVTHPRFREKAGRSQYACTVCSARFHGKRDTESRLGWMPDLDSPVVDDHVDPIECTAEDIFPNNEQVAEYVRAEEFVRLRSEYEIPVGAFDIESDGDDCIYTLWFKDKSGETWTEVFIAERRAQ